MAIKFEKHTGPAKCWKCGEWVEEGADCYLALDMVGRPSLDDEQFIQPLPEFCIKCYEKINK